VVHSTNNPHLPRLEACIREIVFFPCGLPAASLARETPCLHTQIFLVESDLKPGTLACGWRHKPHVGFTRPGPRCRVRPDDSVTNISFGWEAYPKRTQTMLCDLTLQRSRPRQVCRTQKCLVARSCLPSPPPPEDGSTGTRPWSPTGQCFPSCLMPQPGTHLRPAGCGLDT
jgi:hypothetical protein